MLVQGGPYVSAPFFSLYGNIKGQKHMANPVDAGTQNAGKPFFVVTPQPRRRYNVFRQT